MSERNEMQKEAGNVKSPTLTLNPEERKVDLSFMQPSFGNANPADQNDDAAASAGSVDESMLTEEEKKQVEEFVKQIDVSDVKMVNSYGSSAQKGISTFSASITGTVKTKEFGEVGDSLRELREAIGSTVAPEKKGIFGFFQKGKQKATYLISNFESAETSIKKNRKRSSEASTDFNKRCLCF